MSSLVRVSTDFILLYSKTYTENVLALPQDCNFVEATSYGASQWTRTAKITTTMPDGNERLFFMKISTGEAGKIMLQGEHEGMLAIHRVMPSFAPKPIAWGKYRDSPSTYFFICEFIHMEEALPDPVEFCSQLAELHKRSISPNGKFGFHVTTCNGTTPQLNTWKESWEVFFAKGLRHMTALDKIVNGKQPELEAAAVELFERVIPRLLGPLQRGDDPIKPCLVHGDMWWGNSAINKQDGKTVIFDASAFYAHNEYEMGNWRPIRSRFDERYFKAYQGHFPKAHPVEDYDDRILLYSM